MVSRGRQVLLVKRKREPFLGTWMMPSGFIEYGEHPEETVRREVREETGLTAQSLNLIGVFNLRMIPGSPDTLFLSIRLQFQTGQSSLMPRTTRSLGSTWLNCQPCHGKYTAPCLLS